MPEDLLIEDQPSGQPAPQETEEPTPQEPQETVEEQQPESAPPEPAPPPERTERTWYDEVRSRPAPWQQPPPPPPQVSYPPLQVNYPPPQQPQWTQQPYYPPQYVPPQMKPPTELSLEAMADHPEIVRDVAREEAQRMVGAANAPVLAALEEMRSRWQQERAESVFRGYHSALEQANQNFQTAIATDPLYKSNSNYRRAMNGFLAESAKYNEAQAMMAVRTGMNPDFGYMANPLWIEYAKTTARMMAGAEAPPRKVEVRTGAKNTPSPQGSPRAGFYRKLSPAEERMREKLGYSYEQWFKNEADAKGVVSEE